MESVVDVVVERTIDHVGIRDSTAAEILKALHDDATNLLGIHGMPGVGKTTLIKEIAKQVKEKQLFEEVVVVIVSQYPDTKKLQGDIAEGLDLKLSGDNEGLRAQRLSERLAQGTKTTLVILDDLWKKIDLSAVGIPYKNSGNRCKVVFTTRDRAVCDSMGVNDSIEVSLLSEEDSWILFQQKSGIVADLSIARELLNECARLPLAIITLGLALRNKDEEVCRDALRQLRKSILKGMSPVDSLIKLSYNYLTDEEKVCFLFCCLFPEDHVIELDVLLSYVMGEKLVKDVDTYEEASSRLYSILDKLVSSGLLLRDEDGDIRMHDVVRDMAVLISTEEEGHIVKAGRNCSYWPDMDLGNCKRLSMMYNPIKGLSTIQIKAPYLQALFLNNNYSLTELPSDFFAEMTSLMTLDLSRTAIESLPTSLSCLQNLRTLLLNRIISLTNLSPIEKLVRLEVLSLRSCGGIELTEEMGNLSNLKVLDLTHTYFIESINPNLISKLWQLETFHWLELNYHEQLDNLEETQLLREVASLSRLTSLQLHVGNPDVCHIEIPGPWVNLTRFKLIVNPGRDFTGFSLRGLSLDEIRVKRVANWVLVLLRKTNYLHLRRGLGVQRLLELGGKGMNDNLNSLHLECCFRMECLVSHTGLLESNENAFSNLEELYIDNMDAFVEIYKGTNPPPTGLLCKLKMLSLDSCHYMISGIPRKLKHNLLNLESLHIRSCRNVLYVLETEEEAESSTNILRIAEPIVLPIFPNLNSFEIRHIPKIRYVFTMRVARNLFKLEYLRIQDCPEMEVILKYEDGEDIRCDQEFKDTSILPRLKKFTVRRAPKLKSFTNQNLLMDLPALEILLVSDCGILERLPFGATSVPNLKTIKMDQEHLHRLEWEDETVKSRLKAILPEIKVNTSRELEDRTVDNNGSSQSKTDNRIIEEEDEKKSSNKGKGLKKWKRIPRPTNNVAASSTSAAGERISTAF